MSLKQHTGNNLHIHRDVNIIYLRKLGYVKIPSTHWHGCTYEEEQIIIFF